MGVRGRPVTWDHFYSTARWARLRRHQLLTYPLCAFCAERGLVVPATICDHVEPQPRRHQERFALGKLQVVVQAVSRRRY